MTSAAGTSDNINGSDGGMARALPGSANAQFLKGVELTDAGQYDEALVIFRRILEDNPDDAIMWSNVGGQFLKIGKFSKARDILNHAIALGPDMAEAYNNLGGAHLGMRNPQFAIASLNKALKLNPRLIDTYANLVLAYKEIKDLDKAVTTAKAMLELPDYSPGFTPNLIGVFRGVCDFDGLAKLGDIWGICDQIRTKDLTAMFLTLLVYAEDDVTIAKLRKLIDRWAREVEDKAALNPLPPSGVHHGQDKLRIGFLSSDLRSHAVGKFLTELFSNYDHDRFAFFCYAPYQAAGDPIQQLFQDNADSFQFVVGLTEREIAEKIQADGIDILLELNGFTKWSRAPVLAYKPAPVQISWLGYTFTCGLEAIDYAILDRFLKPVNENTLVEEPVIMPGACICFDSMQEQSIASDLPLDRNGVVTFGTLSNPFKYTPAVIALWAEVLKRVPESRFLVVRPEVKSLNFCRNLAGHFEAEGISADRLYFINNKAGDASHLAYYNEIDITLDTFPVSGGITTCDAIWMGVPVVALVGEAFHQRVGYSVLMHCGLEELCNFSPEDYVKTAVSLAGDRNKLLAWRHGLRDVMEASPIRDKERFVHEFQDMLSQVADLHGLRGLSTADKVKESNL